MSVYRQLVLFCCLLILPGIVFAQDAQQGTITGYIFDASQAVIPFAEVTATSQSTGLTRSAMANEAGLYTFVGMQPGVYDIKATVSGFKTSERKGIILDVGGAIRVNFTMQLGEVSETVTVEALAPVLKTETGEVANLITGTQVTEIALNGRNFTQFLALGTGVVSQQSSRQMGLGQEGNPLMAVNGGRISMNKFTYDGTLAMDTGGNRGLNLFPPMEAISEVKVQKSNYGADQGGFGYGIVNVVTKAGGNEFHGGIYEYLRNEKLDARNFFSNERQAIKGNNFGYTIGGPFFIPGKYNTDKTKDFFFFSHSWSRRVGPQIVSFTQPPTGVFTSNVPTAAMRAGDFSEVNKTVKDPDTGQQFAGNIIPASRIDPNATILLDALYPLPNRAGSPNYVYNTRAFTRYREELIRWDHHFTGNWSLMARYAQDTYYQDQDVKKPGGSVFPTFPNLFGKPGKNFTTKLTTIATPKVLNLFTFGYSFNEISNDIQGGFRPAGLSIPEAFPSNQYNVIPTITIGQGYGNLATGAFLQNTNPIYTFKDDISVVRGSHTLKFGAELIHHRKTQLNYANEFGTFNFNGAKSGDAFADFLLGRAFTYTENDADRLIEIHTWNQEFYVQDDFRATRNLTINMGLRYYLILGGNGGAAVDDKISTFVPEVYDPAAAPTLKSNGQLVPDTGDPLNGIITPKALKGLDLGRDLKTLNKKNFGPRLGIAWNPGGGRTVFRGGYGINYFWGTDNNVARKTNPPFNNSVNVQNPLLSNPTGGTSRLFPSNLNAIDVYNKQPTIHSWSFSIQRQLMSRTNIEVSYVGTRGVHLPRGIQLNQADPTRTGNANLRRPYLGFGTIAYRENTAESMYNALQMSFVRRMSGGLRFETSYTFSKALGHVEGNPLDSHNKDLDYGLTTLDRTHMFALNYVWEMPFFRDQGGVAGALLGGWQISGITTFLSGLPINVTQSGDVANFGGGTGGQRPDLVGDPNQGRGDSLDRYFNVDAFQRVTTTGSIGNAPVFAVRGPGVNNWDISFFKNISIKEQAKLQLGVETFNTFNHPQFEGVGSGANSATFGVVNSARDPRVVQIRMKLTF